MKKLPPFLLGASLLFWGWQTGISVWGLAFPMAILVESSYWFDRRWDISDGTFQNLSKITLTITFILYFFGLLQSLVFIYTLIKFLPILLFPLLITQIYSTRDALNINLLFSFLKVPKSTQSPFTISLEIPYLFIVIVSASAGNQQSPWFYGGMLTTLGILLWKVRSKRHSFFVWLLLLSMAALLGLWGSAELYKLQGYVEQSTEQWFDNFFQPNDPLTSNTRIGDLGSLKQSNEIRFRVKLNNLNQEFFKVRQAVYNRYQSSIWVAKDSKFKEIKPLDSNSNWPIALSDQNADTLSLTIYDFFPEKKGLLKLPNGSYNVKSGFIAKLEKSQYGSVKMNSQNKWLNYDVSFQPSQDFSALPDATDLEVPISEKNALRKIINEFEINQKNDQEKVKQIESFFANHFGYSLKFEDEKGNPKSLSSFLLTNRSGHCEYFATATTLLLREMGIPSRYITGYVVAEYSPLERLYLVRSRHAHAWTLAYINGSWQEIDTTPSNWFSLEEQDLPQASWLSQFLGFIHFKMSQGWQWSIHQSWFKYGVLLIPLFLILRWQKIWKKSSKFSRKSPQKLPKLSLDSSSDLYLIEQSLNKRGLCRSPSETFKQWFIRLKQENQIVGTWEDLLPIIELYYRERFDPKGLTPSEHKQLIILVKAWLKK